MRKFLLTILFCLFATRGFAQTSISSITQITGKQAYTTTIGADNDAVYIGDQNAISAVSFTPQVTFTKWNKENSLTIKLPAGLINSTIPTLSANQVSISGGTTGFYFNPDPNDSTQFKFGLIFYNKPSTNVFNFNLVDNGELDYFQQENWTVYNQVTINGDIYYEHTNPDGSVVRHKPEVQGSYAVYHKTKVNNQYQTGKFGHIYCPKFIDANNNFVYASINIANGVYTITIPQSFLDTAVYPVKANDTYGSTSKGASEYASYNGVYTAAFNISGTMPANGTISQLSFWTRYNVVQTTGYVNYYKNSGAKSATSDLSITYGNTDNTQHSYTYNFSGQSESSGDKLALAFLDESGGGGVVPNWACDATAGTDNGWRSNTYAPASIDSTKPSTNAAQYQFSTWMTYTPSGGSAAITGTITPSVNATAIQTGGNTIIITLTGDTWVAAGATFNAQRQNIINGITSSTTPTNGWNNQVKANIAVTDVVQTSSTVVTVTLDAESAYSIAEGVFETVAVTIPSTAVTSATSYVATPTFQINSAFRESINNLKSYNQKWY